MADYFKQSLMNQSAEAPPAVHNNDGFQLPNVENLHEKLEVDVIDDVDVNFLFFEGSKLFNGLIDPERLYNITNKLKDLAIK